MRHAIATALDLAVADPGAWLVALAGFLARGGVLLFVLLLVELPSPITVTLIFGVDAVTGTGQPTERLVVAVVTLTAVAGVGLVAMALTAAWADVVAYGRARPEDQGRPALGRPSRRRFVAGVADVLGVAWLQALGLVPAVIAFALAAPTVGQVAVSELLLPSSSAVPYLVRVLTGAQLPLVRAVVVLAVAELLVTVATRRYLGAREGRAVVSAYLRAFGTVVRAPVRVAVAWILGWTSLLAGAAAGLWAVALAWAEVRIVLLDRDLVLPVLPGACEGRACVDPWALTLSALGAAGAVALFVAVLFTALALIGLASAFRAALWTMVLGAVADERTGVRWPADAPV